MENENQMTMAVSQSTISPSTASIYVGDLHMDMTDGELFDAFKEFKSLTSVRICRDAVTGRSLCYGYVNFISPQDGIHFFSPAYRWMYNFHLNVYVVCVCLWYHLSETDTHAHGYIYHDFSLYAEKFL